MKKIQQETHFKGLGLSPGVGIARVCLFREEQHDQYSGDTINPSEVDLEIERLIGALEAAVMRLDEMKMQVAERIGPAEGEIFTVQKMILQDPEVVEKLQMAIREELQTAEAAIQEVFEVYEEQFRDIDNSYFSNRVSDLSEAKRRVLNVLGNSEPSLLCVNQPHCRRGRERIVVANELTPSLTMELDTEHTIGFVTERGGINSHAAILAKALGIPAVSGIKGIHRRLTCGTEILVNGDTGEVVVHPTEETISRTMTEYQHLLHPLVLPPVSNCKVMASINRQKDLDNALTMQPEGIGLYRTEFEMIAANRVLKEEEQEALYEKVVKRVDDMVYFRLLDIGGDKPLPCLDLQVEKNPVLGLRGARLLLNRPDLLIPQARALAKVSQLKPIKIMYPMIASLNQFLALKRKILDATADIAPQHIEHGVMFEVPSACLEAEELFDVADFGSIGSNDLIQYLFAVDRDNESVASDYDPDQPVFWQLLQNLAEIAHRKNKPLSFCGELAGDLAYINKLLSLGIQIFSVSPRFIASVRRAAANYASSSCGSGSCTQPAGR